MSLRFEREITEYADLGFDCLPLLPGTKRAIVRDWQNRAPSEMWQGAPTDANIGLRCGGELRLAVFDADDKHDAQTSANLTRYLAGLGIDEGDCPVIATPSSGRHFYTMLLGELPGHARQYCAEVGAGEFRYGEGAYVAAPPSVVNKHDYRLIAGDFRSLARIEVRDVLPLLRNQDTTPAANAVAPTPGTPTISRRARRLLQGEGIERYHSRSEYEQAILASLANTGHGFDAVLSLFIAYPCGGKFKELYAKNRTRAVKWLRHSFEEARRFVETHESRGRQSAVAALQWAQAHIWQGKTGLTDRAVFIASATIAYHAGAVEVALPCRTVAELAQVNSMTASRALYRLTDTGLLVPVKTAVASLANVYRFAVLHLDTLPNPLNVRKCINLQQGTHDAFRARGYGRTFKAPGLGKAAALVFNELRKGEPLTVCEISERTGRGRKTVYRVLNRMARIIEKETGEVLAMVEQDDAGKWRACEDVDLDRIAKALGTFGGNEWQRKRHAEERREHRERLAEGSNTPH